MGTLKRSMFGSFLFSFSFTSPDLCGAPEPGEGGGQTQGGGSDSMGGQTLGVKAQAPGRVPGNVVEGMFLSILLEIPSLCLLGCHRPTDACLALRHRVCGIHVLL